MALFKSPISERDNQVLTDAPDVPADAVTPTGLLLYLNSPITGRNNQIIELTEEFLSVLTEGVVNAEVELPDIDG